MQNNIPYTHSSPALSRERGMVVWGDGSELFAEHLLQHVSEQSLLFGSQRSNSVLQPCLVHRANLVGRNLTISPINLTGHAIRIAVDGGRNGNNDDRGEMLVNRRCPLPTTGLVRLYALASRRQPSLGARQRQPWSSSLLPAT